MNAFSRAANPYLADLLARLDLDKQFVRGAGCYLWDIQENQYLDFVAAYGALPFGHHPQELWAAIDEFKRSEEPIFCQPSILVSAGELAEKLISRAPAGLKYVTFANSGTEAVEAAIKAARAATGRLGIVSANNSFHGKTLGSLSATGNEDYQKQFGAPALDFYTIPFGDSGALSAILENHAIAAVLLEPIQGEGGIHMPPDGYFSEVAALCKQYGALLVFDEVQTGLGRTGDLFACEKDGVTPDILVLAKALGGGILPIGACLLSEAAYTERFALKHSSTFAGNGLACRVGSKMLDLLTPSFLSNVSGVGTYLKHRLENVADRYPNVVSSVRGRGLLLGLEFDVSRTKFPRDVGTQLGLMGEQNLLTPLLSSYLLNVHKVRVAPTLNGARVLRIEPPLTITHEQCDDLIAAIEETVMALSRGDSGKLLAHLAGTAVTCARARKSQLERIDVHPSEQRDEGRFAFLVHPIDSNSVVEFDRTFEQYSDAHIRQLDEKIGDVLAPFVVSSVRLTARGGETAHGIFIVVPRTADSLLKMRREDAKILVRNAVDLAVSLGAKVVGLGGYTSVITRGGRMVSGRNDVAVTSGNSYTVIAAIEASLEACRRLSLDPTTQRAAIVGAGGSVGSATSRLLACQVGSLCLVGNPANLSARKRFIDVVAQTIAFSSRTEVRDGSVAKCLMMLPDFPQSADDYLAFAEKIINENGKRVPLTWSVRADEVIPTATMIVVATSSSEELIQPDYLRRGAIVCDLSRPSNVSKKIKDSRPDVLVIDGGVVAVPGMPDLGWNFGFPAGLAYACMSETFMLALSHHYEDTSIGTDLSDDNLIFIQGLADKFGFKVAELRSFDRPLSEEDWERLRKELGRPESGAIRLLDDNGVLNATTYLVDRHCDSGHGSHVAIFEGDRHVTYGNLQHNMFSACSLFLEASVEKGQVVVFITHDTIESVSAMLAVWRMGAIAVYLNPELLPSDYEQQLEKSKAEVFVVDEIILDLLTENVKKRISSKIVLRTGMFVQGEGNMFTPANTTGASLAFCLFTSGSTGRPKGVCHSHGDLIATNQTYVREVLAIDRKDVLFSPSKLYFAYGLNSLHYALFAGASIVLPPKQAKPLTILNYFEQYRPTVFFTVPTLYRILLKKMDRDYDLSSLRLCVSAGENLPKAIFDTWFKQFNIPIIDGIGTTEVLSTFISNRVSDFQSGSTGKVVVGFEVRLFDEEGNESEVGKPGVLWVRGPTLPIGYWRDSGTSPCFREGWFNTNDVFYRDERGYYFFVGRRNEIFKVGGAWVSPLDIERCLLAHQSVAECAVVPVVEFTTLVRPKAFVVLREEYLPSEELKIDLQSFVRKRLITQHPHYVEFIDVLPKTHTGKLRRFLLSNTSAS